MPELSILIPTYSQLNSLRRAIQSLVDQSEVPEIVIVDNASPSRIGDAIGHEFGSRVKVVRLDKNYFYCGAVNRGAAHCAGRYLGVLNDDAWVDRDWVGRTLETFRLDASIGSVATLVRAAADTNLVDSAGDRLNICGHASNIGWGTPVSEVANTSIEVFSAAGSCAVYRRDAYMLAGGFDDDFVAYLDDIDLGFRLQLLGFRCLFNPLCTAFHEGGATYKPRLKAQYLTERNMYWNLVKNMPLSILRKHASSIVGAQSRPAPISGGSSIAAWSAGKAHAHIGLSKILRKRRRIQLERRVSDNYIEGILSSTSIGVCHL